MTPRISKFGITADGRTVHRLILSNGTLSAAILTYGATLQDLRILGIPHSLTIGCPDIAAYEGPLTYCGAIVGPVANRIGGAKATIDGTTHRFDANESGRNTLHGGHHGTHAQIWHVVDQGHEYATLTLDLADGHLGFPGNRTLTARFTLDGSTLSLTLDASTDKPTLMNLANHSYWRLDDATTTQGQILRIAADRYLPSDADLLPTGAIAPVADTRFDYRMGAALRAGEEGLLDTNFCLANARQPLRRVASLTGRSGVSLTLATTEPGLQVYDGHSIDHGPFGPYAGLALEPQFWPDAPNNPDFPDITLHPGTPWKQITTWTFKT